MTRLHTVYIIWDSSFSRVFFTSSEHSRRWISDRNRQEKIAELISLLERNRDGLTAGQIARLMGGRTARTILLQLRKEGKVRQKRGYSTDGRVSFIYVLDKKLLK